jgi:hypothetical protein
MAIIVNSPFSGNPVKVRDQDVGRAVKDEEGRIFYVLEKSDGSGHYGSITRSGAGAAKDEERATKMEDTQAVRRGNVHAQVESARGGGGSKLGKLFVLVIVLGALAFCAWVFLLGGKDKLRERWNAPPPPAQVPLNSVSPPANTP